MIPISKCFDESHDRELIEVVALKRSVDGLELVSALIDAAAGTKNTENIFITSVTKALGAGNTCDFGACIGVYFNQYLRPYIRCVVLYIFCFITFIFTFSFAKKKYMYRWLRRDKRVISKMALHFSFKLQRMVYCCPNNTFFDKQLGVINSDQAGLIFDTKTFVAQSFVTLFCLTFLFHISL